MRGSIPLVEAILIKLKIMNKIVFSFQIMDDNGVLTPIKDKAFENAFAIAVDETKLTRHHYEAIAVHMSMILYKLLIDPLFIGSVLSVQGNFVVERASLIRENDNELYRSWISEYSSEDCYNAIHRLNGSSLESLLPSTPHK